MSKDIGNAIHELKYLFADKGLEIEFIKTNAPLYIDGNQIESIDGVKITQVIYEDDATHSQTTNPPQEG